jgi:hypothetical protein
MLRGVRGWLLGIHEEGCGVFGRVRLPQLINVLMGDMSIIGARPEVPNFVETS